MKDDTKKIKTINIEGIDHKTALTYLGEKIKFARKNKRITLKEMSYKMKISTVTLWSLEKGTPTIAIGTYFKVISYLGLSEEILNSLKSESN